MFPESPLQLCSVLIIRRLCALEVEKSDQGVKGISLCT